MQPYDHLVLDWNGTLVDDVALAVESVNALRHMRALSPIKADEYRKSFCFPIETFYRNIGFQFPSGQFSAIAAEYLALFNADVLHCGLHAGVVDLVEAARTLNMTVSILSASHSDILIQTIEVNGLRDKFHHILGLDDHAAAGKLDLARDLDSRLGQPGERALLVGDTTHDRDVARAVGWTAALVVNGHQAPELFAQDDPMFEDLAAVAAHLYASGPQMKETTS